MDAFIFWLAFMLLLFVLFGFRIIRPVEKGVVERFGKFRYVSEQGLRWIIPLVDRMRKVNVTEIRLDVEKQSVITKDNLNLSIDAVVYFKVNDVTKSIYNVNDYMRSIPSLAQTTLRSVIGELPFTEVNANRNVINTKLESDLDTQTQSWGIDILRVELQDVQPSNDVQRAMDQVVTAEREKEAKITKAAADKEAAKEIAEARIIDAEAKKTAAIETAMGEAEAIRLRAEAKATAIKSVNDSVEASFMDKAQLFRRLEVTENSLVDNSKIVITSQGISPTLVMNEGGETVIPLKEQL